jgi:multiple sugar transport system substrate-binding protein
MVQLKGMTWAHRRAADPLLATLPTFQRRHPSIELSWDARPLSGFESQSVKELADSYDLIVLDHPFAGDIAAGGYLLPLDDLLSGCDGEFVGPSLETYRYAGSIWALPIDAACQVAVSRPDLMARLGADVPQSWADVLTLGKTARRNGLFLAIGFAGVHSLMTFFTLMASLGWPCATAPNAPFCSREAARVVLAAMRTLLPLCPRDVLSWSSIRLHDAMVSRDDLVYCPAVYCYATYAEADQRRPLRFHDLPGLGTPSPGGSTIGGTGLGISAACQSPEAALVYAKVLRSVEVQKKFAAHHGQPARIEAWEDPAIDARFGGCFSATRATMEGSWIRPRYRGYLSFQEEGGHLVERHLRGEIEDDALLSALEDLHAAATRQ